MASVLLLEDDRELRKKILALLVGAGHSVISCQTVSEAREIAGHVDLYVCGPLGKHSDGLVFALEKADQDKRVVIVANRRKFSRLPFVSHQQLKDKEAGHIFKRIMAGT